MLIVCADILSQYLFLGCCTCMQSVILWSFFGMATVNIFVSVNKMTLTSLDEFFQQLFF